MAERYDMYLSPEQLQGIARALAPHQQPFNDQPIALDPGNIGSRANPFDPGYTSGQNPQYLFMQPTMYGPGRDNSGGWF